MTALFRLVELQSGKIYVDGVDISPLGLGDLRSRLSSKSSEFFWSLLLTHALVQ